MNKTDPKSCPTKFTVKGFVSGIPRRAGARATEGGLQAKLTLDFAGSVAATVDRPELQGTPAQIRAPPAVPPGARNTDSQTQE